MHEKWEKIKFRGAIFAHAFAHLQQMRIYHIFESQSLK